MSRTLSKMIYGILIVVIAISLIGVFREQILTNSGLGKLFSTVLEELPFVKVIADAVTKMLGYQYNPWSFTADSFMEDMLKLAVMTLIRPLIVSLLMALFLPMPPRNQILQTTLAPMSVVYEDYTETFGYKIKALIISIISTIPLALLAGWLIGVIQNALRSVLGQIGSVAVQTVLLVVILALSVIRLASAFRGGYGAQKAVLWRSTDFLFEMIKTLITEAMCIMAYMLFASQKFVEMLGPFAGFLIFMILIDAAMQLMHRAIV